MASITEALNVKIKRVGKYFYCTYKIGEAERVFTIDLQEITGLSDEEMAQLLTRLDANKESDKASE